MARLRWRTRLLLFFGGLVFALVAAEVGVRIFWSRLGPPPDPKTDYPLLDTANVGRGFKLRPGATFHTRYDSDPYGTLPADLRIEYRLNQAGFRDPPLPTAGGPQVVALGDSFTFGEGVEVENRFTAVLAAALAERLPTPPRVVNLALPGYASEDESEVARERLPALSPDVVLVGYCLNDPVHLVTEEYVSRYGNDLVVRREHEFEGPSRSPSYLLRLVNDAARTRRLTEMTVEWYRGMYEGPDPAWRKSREYLAGIRDLAAERGATMAVVILPIFFRLEGGYPFETAHAEVARWCHEEGIPVLDTLPLFLGRDTETLVVHPKDHHPNAAAHRVIGEAAAGFVEAILHDH